LLRSHGITGEAADMDARPVDEIWNYQQIALGFNYRMTDIHAALGLSQMRRLDEFVSIRHEIARRYDHLLLDTPVVTPWQHADGYSSFHLYAIRLKRDQISLTQREVFTALRAAGILANLHYIPVYRQPYYERLGFEQGYCPVAERYFQETISLPMYPQLTTVQQDSVVLALSAALKK
jgi:dTDP-4-amino-4,6-dideoxygalactose transaminase